MFSANRKGYFCLIGFLVVLISAGSSSANVSRAPVVVNSTSSTGIVWDKEIDGSTVKIPTRAGIRRFSLGFGSPNFVFQECKTPNDSEGRCRYLQYCAYPEILQSYTTYLRHVCFINGEFVGVCCRETTAAVAPSLSDQVVTILKNRNPSVNPSAAPITVRTTTKPTPVKNASKRPTIIKAMPARKPITNRPSRVTPVLTNSSRSTGSPLDRIRTTSISPILGKQHTTPKPTGAITCGNLQKEETRVVGGQAARADEWPWMVGIFQRDGRVFCGGALISNQYVLSAAHCFRNTKASDIRVRLGEYDLRTVDKMEMDFSVTEIYPHRLYDRRTQLHDIALLKLARPAFLSTDIQPICLPTSNDLLEGRAAYVAGWGSTSFLGSSSPLLMEVLLPIWKQSECKAALGENTMFTNVQLCAGFKAGGKDSCQGDSGGPLMYRSPRTEKWTLGGLVSWGKECGKAGQPGVYTRVSSYLPWIKAKIAESILPS